MVNPLGRTDSKETHDAESLRKIVVTIRNLLAPAIRLAGEPEDSRSQGVMQAHGVKELEISFYQSLERAMKELSRWGSACENAWAKQLIGQSAALAGPSKAKSSAKPAAKAKKKR
jgi:hypothetical protein